MIPGKSMRLTFIVVLALSFVATIACNKSDGGSQSASASTDSGKISITTKSEEARKEFVAGRELAEKLRAQDSVAHLDKAIALDPDFAAGELARANSAPTAKDFFEHLNKAVALAGKASDGERLLILANEAGANGDVVKQKEYLDKLVAVYPDDARALISPAITLGNRSTSRRLRITKRRLRSLPAIRRPTISSGMPTGSWEIIRMRSRLSRNTSS